MKNSKYLYILSVLFCSLFMFSCEEEETISEVKVDRLFRPVGLTASVSGVDVTLACTPIKNATYIVELSKDSLLFENELQPFEFGEEAINGNSIVYKIEGYCWSNTRYSARIKSISSDPAVEDSGWQEVTFVTGSEDTFYPVKSDDISFNSVLLKWDSAKDVTHIVASTSGKADITVPLSSAEISAGEKLIQGLSINTAYSFTIYLNNRPRGQVSATTKGFITLYINQQINGGDWYPLGTYQFFPDANAYVKYQIGTNNGYVIADAFKFSMEGYSDIIVDNDDASTVKEGTWVTGTGVPKIGSNYYSSNANNVSVTYFPTLPVAGKWTVSVFYSSNTNRATNVPIIIFGGYGNYE